MKKIVLGITGLNGSGKSTVAKYLTEKKNFRHISIREYIVKELEKRNIEPLRKNMRVIANEMRSKHGADYFIKQVIDDAQKSTDNIVIESIRTVNEISILKSNNYILLAVTAPLDVRYDRIIKRKSETDFVSKDEFIELENAEAISNNDDEQNLCKALNLADYQIQNTTIEQFRKDIDNLIERI